MKKLYLIITLLCLMVLPAGSCFAQDEETGSGHTVSEITDQPALYYEAYLHEGDWSGRCTAMQSAGDPYGTQTIDAIRMQIDLNRYLDIIYRVHNKEGWTPWVKNNELAGTPGKAIDGIEIRLEGRASIIYDVSYAVMIDGKGWQKWTKEKQTAGDLQNVIRAIRIKIE
ncbi:MAG: hypothetical protein K6C05_04515 [Anaerovibrio sp.]|uniref:hypothetical protein n=1 Tax=Anaerovibrio sp. TaxID=1872532 RepID=UPI0025CEE276|nr:hypothetical protein [Anaerovibrio sp.]MCR5176093.1 hypothetical protein [Anaerovibrio sp.]